MKSLLVVFGVLIATCVAERFYQSSSLYENDQVHLIKHPFTTKESPEFTYVIEFPELTQYVLLMRTVAIYEDIGKKCGPAGSVSMWNMTMYNGNGNCKWERDDAMYGSMIRCDGKIHFYEYDMVHYMFMLVNCNSMGLNGVHFEIYNYDKPITAASSTSCISALFMTLSAVASFIF